MIDHDVKDLKLADKGRLRMEWSSRFMPVLNSIKNHSSQLLSYRIAGVSSSSPDESRMVPRVVLRPAASTGGWCPR